MPRPVVLGNNRLTVAMDRRHSVRDLFYPEVGCPNHLSAHKVRLGVWVDGRFEWCDEGAWECHQAYRVGSLVAEARLHNSALELEVTIVETVHPHHDWWARRLTVRNLARWHREVRLFQTHDLRINETDIGDTAFYHPGLGAVVHYKDQVYISFGFQMDDGRAMDQWACGMKAFNGFLGTYKDAEDGHLSGKPVEQGSVDSTMGISLPIGPGDSVPLWVVTAAATEAPHIEREHRALVGSLDDDWFACRPVTVPATGLGGPVDRLCAQSLEIIEAHYAKEGGLVASLDSDIMQTNRATYGSVWFRDASVAAMQCLENGHTTCVQNLIAFGRDILGDQADRYKPYFLQKYLPSGSVAASWHPWTTEEGPEVPFQQDETALYVSMLAKGAKDDPAYVPLVKALAQFMLDHRADDGLPLPSWDLWEERRGVHFWTTATVVDALRDAAGYLAAHDRGFDPEELRAAADRMRSQASALFTSPVTGRLARMFVRRDGARATVDDTPDSSVLAGLLRPSFSQDLELLRDTVAWVEADLGVKSPVGGVARYAGDYYFRQSDDYPGNPWVISAMWVAQARARLGDLVQARNWLDWAVARAETTYVLAEQYHPETGEPLSVSPLPWSHVEVLETVRLCQVRSAGD
ncbi:MAG: glycoside hydrolase family 15 protein [Fimbriimonadaceae bacterium]|nr:glycoside hydrolase family 15 protein [Fimbriimonadaceae bacterium]